MSSEAHLKSKNERLSVTLNEGYVGGFPLKAVTPADVIHSDDIMHWSISQPRRTAIT